MITPWLPAGHTAVLAGRGEVFYRHHQHPDPDAPMLLLLHGWTASADLQFFTAYEDLARDFSFIAIDHRGHGRGMRPTERFELEDVADDAAALVEHLGIAHVILVGYSMGGPLSLLLTQRHPHLVEGVVIGATSMEWNSTRRERVRWKTVRLLSPVLRSWAYPSWLRAGLRMMARREQRLEPYVDWLAGELSRNSAVHLVHAGQALSRFDAVSWARNLAVPSGMLITTRDHLVKPSRQRAVAAALEAHVVEIAGDHGAPWLNASEFSSGITTLARRVAAQRTGSVAEVEALAADR